MNRVEAAIQEGRCVIAIGGRALGNPDVLMELRRRSALPMVSLGGDPVDPVIAMTADSLAVATSQAGGVLVLVEPEGGTDGRALGELEKLIKAAPNTPRLVVAARSYNPFMLPMGMRLMKTEQVKQRAQDFLASLPVPTAAPVAAAPAAAAAAAPEAAEEDDRHRAARPEVVDREDEQATIKSWLSEAGSAVIISGPPGVGKRWLAEAVLGDVVGDDGLVRIPDLTFGRGSGADSFLARLAIAARGAGDERLHVALAGGKSPAPVELAALVLEVAQGDALANHVWLLHDMESLLDRRDGSFYREGRLEMILKALLTAPLSLKLIFTSELQVQFHSEGLGQHLRRLVLKGLPGKTLHELFELWHAPEFDRDRFGPIAERTFGHPIAARTIAITSRTTPIDELLEQPRYLKGADPTDLAALERILKRRIGELDDAHADALAAVAVLREAASPEELNVLGVNRTLRIELMAQGLLEQTPVQNGRRYYVHRLIKGHLDRRKVEDFGRMETLGQHFLEKSKDLKRSGDASQSLALAIAGNRLLTGARRARSRMRLPYSDMDAVIDDVRSLLRRRQPRVDIARMRVSEALNAGSNLPEILMAQAEVLAAEKASVERVEGAWLNVQTVAPTPEAFHQEASWHLARGSRGKAVEALLRGAETFPDNARMRRRLAGLYIQQNRLDDAATVLREAMELEPMMADTYSLLGEVYVALGQAHWQQAAEVLQEAVELAPGDAHHKLRVASLLHARGCAAPAERASLWEQAEAFAREAWQADQTDQRAAVQLARITLDRPEALDAARLDQVEYILRQNMKKRQETPEVLIQRARVLVHREAWREASELIDRVLQKSGGDAAAFAARGELWEAQHQPFHAFEAWKAARERTRPDTAERMLADEHVARLQTLIEQGRAAEMMREKGVEPAGDAAAAGFTPKRASKVKRRRKGQSESTEVEGNEAEGSDAEGSDAEGSDAQGDVAEEPAREVPLQAADEAADGVEEEADDDTSSSSEGGDDDSSTTSAPVGQEAPVEEPPVEEPPVEEPPAEEPPVEEPPAEEPPVEEPPVQG